MIAESIMEAQRQSLEFVTNIQDRMVKANRELADSFGGMFESLPLPDLNIPTLVDTKTIDQAFDITAEWLKASQTFAHDMVAAWMPEAPKAKAVKK